MSIYSKQRQDVTKFKGHTMTISFSVIWIPTLITFIGVVCPFICVKDTGGMFSGLDNLMYLLIGLPIALISWIVYGIIS